MSKREPAARRSVIALLALTLASALVGFVWLPAAQPDFSARGLWDGICRAAGVPASWSAPGPPAPSGPPGTEVVLTRAMTRVADRGSVGRGATLALNCTMCHGAQGLSASDAPNLAGQYPEVVIKQLHDYKAGRRRNAVMQALVENLTAQDIDDLAAYYAYLPKARTAPTRYDETLPALVRVGDPLRNIAPCIACHGGVDQKLGAPWLEGMPQAYLAAQLQAFKDGTRRNDGLAQMRNMAAAMSAREIDAVAAFYARKHGDGEPR